MQICFFSDKKSINFNPLILTRPVDDLRIGIFTIRIKWENLLKANNSCRIISPELEGVFPKGKLNSKEPCVWINSRYLPTPNLVDSIFSLQPGQAITYEDDIVAAKIEAKISQEMLTANKFESTDLDIQPILDATFIENIWDLLSVNAAEIERDLPYTGLQHIDKNKIHQGINLVNPEYIYVDEHAVIEPGTTIIATDGPVVIQKGVTIEAGSILRGPVAICEDARIMMGAQIYEGATIGPACKIGGVVGKSIFHSYSNKAHDGFIGNSIFGQWVNIGADTNTSNLKNNYSTVRLTHWDSRQEVETGVQFLGTVMGDHSKTAINTMLNTGTICGVSANIFMTGFPPKFIPSFSWVGSQNMDIYNFEKAVVAMEAMMKRRNIAANEAYIAMMQNIFDNR